MCRERISISGDKFFNYVELAEEDGVWAYGIDWDHGTGGGGYCADTKYRNFPSRKEALIAGLKEYIKQVELDKGWCERNHIPADVAKCNKLLKDANRMLNEVDDTKGYGYQMTIFDYLEQ